MVHISILKVHISTWMVYISSFWKGDSGNIVWVRETMLIVIFMFATFVTKQCSSDIASAFPVVPAIECDMRAGKINLPEFIVKCPANCRESKEKVYGTGVFASISSVCNAAIHRWAQTAYGQWDPVLKYDQYKGEWQYCEKAWAYHLIKKKLTQTLHRFLQI